MTQPVFGNAGPGRKPGDGGAKHSRIRHAAQQTGVGTALVLLALIVLPSAFLGYLSWRAIENEKSYSLERLRESYQPFARLAARQIDHELGDLEARWTSEIERVLDESDSLPTARQLAQLSGKEPLIAGYFLINAPGRTVYPPIPLNDDRASVAAWKQDTHLREHEIFTQLVARGEELEYLTGDLNAATVAYRQILDQVSDLRLRAMAESYIGRTQLKNGDRAEALATFRRLLERYPEARDLNRMYLRFLAQYQIAVALEGLGRDQEALDALLELNQDLQKRSDGINSMQ